jgi:aminopeptidase YwaD
MKKILFTLSTLFIVQVVAAQKLKKADKELMNNLRTHISYLADDKLEGRRAGTDGERLAYLYLTDQFRNIGLAPKGDSGYIQPFEINDGKQISKTTYFIINGNDLKIGREFFPLQFSASNSLEATPVMAFQEKGTPWFWDIKPVLEQNKNNPHFDLIENIKVKANDLSDKGATALIIYNSSDVADELRFEGQQRSEAAKIPVIYMTKEAKEKYLQDSASALDMKLKVAIEDKKRIGHNVVGYLDNGAANTIIIGAHYDHLGYGEDHNSLWAGTPAIHNGADDNASGTSAVIELARMLKAHNYKNNNYLFICFSGEEMGLFGSKYFTEHPAIDIHTIDYMINLDMIGRLNDSSKTLVIGGYGTSPSWGTIVAAKEKAFSIKFDSSGVGPSDHASFYRKNIPVLFFFTGIHSDYHKPTDDVEKINFTGEVFIIKYIYKIIEQANQSGKLAFAKTKEMSSDSLPHFSVVLGIVPDYSFSGNGVRVDAIVEGKAAQKIGLMAGDVVTALDDNKVSDLTSYMKALGKYKKGDASKVKVLRGKEELTFDVVF